MIPFKDCPVCKVPVRWILYDGSNSYDCSNKQCPITFTERIWFALEAVNFDPQNGLLEQYHFKLDDNLIEIDYRRNFQLRIYPKFYTEKISHRPIIIGCVVEINWENLEVVKNKIKTWIVFS